MNIMSEYLTDKAIKNGIKRGNMMFVDDYLEVKCSLCGEFLLHCTEFFYKDSKALKRLKSRCKACFDENKHHSKLYKTNIVGRPRKVI